MQLPATSTALVLIDLQRIVLSMPVEPHSADTVYQRSMRLAQQFRAVGAPVVRVRVSFSRDFTDALHAPVDQPTDHAALPPGWDEFPDALPPSDLVITKRQWGAFYGTELDLQLRRRGIRCIVLGGIATNIGVESTARNAAELGYELVVPEDLCSSLSAEMHAFSFKNILPRLARITTSDAISLV
jgi:nicotinamidase-related amidase